MSITPLSTATRTSTLTNSQGATQGAASLTPIAQALLKVDQRIQASVDATTTQLSAFGVLKSAVSDVQTAAHALHNLADTVTAADVKTAATGFAAIFNTAINTAKSTSGTLGSGSASTGATRAGTDLRRAMNGNPPLMDALKKMGFSIAADGTLTLDSKKFDAAQKADPAGVKATLVTLGQQMDNAATKELAANGTVGVSMASLSQRAAMVKVQQDALVKVNQTAAAATAATTATSAGTTGLGFSGYGIGAFLSNY